MTLQLFFFYFLSANTSTICDFNSFIFAATLRQLNPCQFNFVDFVLELFLTLYYWLFTNGSRPIGCSLNAQLCSQSVYNCVLFRLCIITCVLRICIFWECTLPTSAEFKARQPIFKIWNITG